MTQARTDTAPSGGARPSEDTRALEGLRVVEFGEYISAPYLGRLLTLYGAEVIKIEPPAGDRARRHGPYPKDAPGDPDRSGLFLYLNAGKLSVTIDPAAPGGADLVLDLARRADILIDNFMPKELEAWGLTPERSAAANPTLVHTSITTFGHFGPYRDFKGYALTASAAGGVAYRTGDPKRQPLAMPYDRADYWGGMNAASATMIAVMNRERTGRGQHVDISTADCLNTFNNPMDYIDYVDTGFYPRRGGNRNPTIYPFVLLPCKDGYYGLIVAHEKQWKRFGDLMGNPAWMSEPRFADRDKAGKEYPEEIDDQIKPWLAQYTKAELWRKFRESRIPWHPAHTVAELLEWEQLQVRDYWTEVSNGGGPPLRVPGAPFKLTASERVEPGPAPRLGEHNEHVFGGLLGRSPSDLEKLRAAGAI